MSYNSIKLLRKLEKKTLFVGEVAQAHNGSLKLACSYIDACKNAGADVVKFQCHYADEESTLDEPFRVKFSKKYKSRFDYWKNMEFTKKEWKYLYNYSRKKGLLFICSVFSLKAFKIINELDVCAWKIASGEVQNFNLIRKIISTKKPIIVSTGLSNYKEIDVLVKYLRKYKANFILMQCTSKYPTPLKDVGINILDQYKKKYKCKIGLSDHSGTIYPSLLACSKKASLVEVHVAFNKKDNGVDSSSSLDFKELKYLTNINDSLSIIINNPVKKNNISNKLRKVKNIFSRSIALKNDMKKGDIIKKNNLTFKKPGFGINPNKINKLIGKRIKKNLSSKRILNWSDFN